tara:strand:- start:211 stop:4236 length:4026 start_codon:yes stop_codon:yes gene_type:complete
VEAEPVDIKGPRRVQRKPVQIFHGEDAQEQAERFAQEYNNKVLQGGGGQPLVRVGQIGSGKQVAYAVVEEIPVSEKLGKSPELTDADTASDLGANRELSMNEKFAEVEASASYLDTDRLELARMKQKIVVQQERPKGRKYNPVNPHAANVNIGGITYRGVPGFGIDESQFPAKALKTLERMEVQHRRSELGAFDPDKMRKFGKDKWKREVDDLDQRIDKLKREEALLYGDVTTEPLVRSAPHIRPGTRVKPPDEFGPQEPLGPPQPIEPHGPQPLDPSDPRAYTLQGGRPAKWTKQSMPSDTRELSPESSKSYVGRKVGNLTDEELNAAEAELHGIIEEGASPRLEYGGKLVDETMIEDDIRAIQLEKERRYHATPLPKPQSLLPEQGGRGKDAVQEGDAAKPIVMSEDGPRPIQGQKDDPKVPSSKPSGDTMAEAQGAAGNSGQDPVVRTNEPPNPNGSNPNFVDPDAGAASRMDQAGNMGATDSRNMDIHSGLGGRFKTLVRLFGSLGARISTYAGPLGRHVASLATDSIDAAKKFEGMVSAELDEVSVMTAKPGWTGPGQAATDLGTPVFEEGRDYAVSKLHDAIESVHATPDDTHSTSLVGAMRNLIHKLGQVTEQERVLVQQEDGSWQPFKSFFKKEIIDGAVQDGGIVAPRIMTGEFFDIIRRGREGELWDKTVDAFAATSGKPRESIEAVFQKKHDAFQSDIQGLPVVQTQAEYVRTWEAIPSAIRHNGETIYLQVTHPNDYARALVTARTNRLGFISKFGQEGGDAPSILQAARQGFKEKGEGLKQFDQLVRALHGVNPTDPLFDPGSWASRWARRLNANIMRPAKAASLTGSFVPNLWEPLGNILTLAGGRVLAKSIVQLARDPKATIAALEQMGAINREFMDLSWDKNFKLRSLTKGASELSSRVFLHKHLNQFQEVLSALVASEKASLWRGGKVTGVVRRGSDISNLRQQGFSLEEATAMVDGSASEELYEKFIRNAPARLTAGNIRPAERSFFEHNRIVRQTIPFQTYAQMKLRSFASHLNTFNKAYKDALTNPKLSPDARYGLLLGAAKNLSSNVIGTSAAGGLAGITTALYYSGTEGSDIELNRMEENFSKYMLESWSYASIGGPFGALLRVAGDRNKVWGALYPVSMGVELFDSMLARKGRYQGLGNVEAALEFAHNFFPGYRAMRGGVIPQAASWIVPNAAAAAAFGRPAFGSERAMDAIVRGLRKRQYEEGDIGSFSNQDAKDFTINMRLAYKALKSGKHPKVVAMHIREALQETGGDWSKVRASINRRRLLHRYKPTDRDTPMATKKKVEKLLRIKRRLGEKNFRRVVQYDAFLTAWGGALPT